MTVAAFLTEDETVAMAPPSTAAILYPDRDSSGHTRPTAVCDRACHRLGPGSTYEVVGLPEARPCPHCTVVTLIIAKIDRT
jgi:hypothetical protein